MPPSPNVQLHEDTPTEVSVNDTLSGVAPELGVYVNEAVGDETVTLCETLEAPELIES